MLEEHLTIPSLKEAMNHTMAVLARSNSDMAKRLARAMAKKRESPEETKPHPEDVERQRLNYVASLKRRSGLSLKDLHRTIDAFRPENIRESRAVGKIMHAAKRWKDKRYSLYIHSPAGAAWGERYGSGKSHLAIAYCLAVMDQGAECRCWTMVEFINQLKAAWQSGSDYQTPVIPALESELVFLDDIEKGPWQPGRYPAVFGEIWRVIDYRSRNDLATVVTSNVHPDELGTGFGGSVADRLAGYQLIELGGRSRRRDKEEIPG